MAETLNILKTRRSCRAYQPELIEEEKLNAILEAGTYAATGMGNLILGYAAAPAATPAPRKENYIYRV